jgi:glutamate dehydrogenase
MAEIRRQTLQEAIQKESKKFEEYYLWVENHMPPSFFKDADPDAIFIVVHSLMAFDLQDFFSQIHFKHFGITLCLDSSDADLQILKHYRDRGIKNYRTFVSNEPPPFPGVKSCLRVAVISYTVFGEENRKEALPEGEMKEVFEEVKKRNPKVTEPEFQKLLKEMDSRFFRSLTKERLAIAFDMFFRARLKDPCQYDVLYDKEWQKKKDAPSLKIVLAWRNVPKHDFLYRLAKVVYRHGLDLKRMAATYIDPYSKENVLLMSLGVHGANGKAAWEETDVDDFLQELVTVKYFPGQEAIENIFVDSGLVRGNIGNWIKTMACFVHQALVHADPHLYSFAHVEEGLCRHPELTVMLANAFEAKFHPEKTDIKEYEKIKESFLSLVSDLDTGHEMNDMRRKNILKQGMSFVEFALKTNFYRKNKTAFSFRFDPRFLDNVPYDRKEKFPELPFAVFMMKGMYFTAFHIRFRDLARGGVRTVFPERYEQFHAERNNVFTECYNLALTQQKKNKDIPEGGSKVVILLEPYERFLPEEAIFKIELENAGFDPKQIEEKVAVYRKEQKLEFLYQAQRSFTESFVTVLNCEADGKLRAKYIVDYYRKPEYIYLGPDELMSNDMIVWISNYAKRYGYKPGITFMSSKPGTGINHKQYGVTSLGVNIYMEEVLNFLEINPTKDPFTIKMTGGPDGDVAGNQMYNLYRFYPKTAKLLATVDVSGTIFDPEGLDLAVVASLFQEGKPIRFYPAEKLSEGGFLLDAKTKREQTAYAQQTLMLCKKEGKLVEEWLSGNEMNHILRTNVHQTKSDIFIPGGGRPRTLNDNNYKDFLDAEGKPTSKAIVEGGNLYLTPGARRSLEKLGVIIIKDSSANKGGVICSSFEVLSGLILSEDEFLKEKETIVQEILKTIASRARDEAKALLHMQGSAFLTDVSDWISERINAYTDELMHYLSGTTLANDPKDPLIQSLYNYCLPLLRTKYPRRILSEVPDIHKKAIIACFLAQRLVYRRGLDWSPSIVDILPLIINDPHIIGS